MLRMQEQDDHPELTLGAGPAVPLGKSRSHTSKVALKLKAAARSERDAW